MSDPRLDPAMRDALDRFTVPPLSKGFTDRIVAAATGSAQPLPATVPPRRDRRGGWMRGHRVIMGAVAFGLMSAAAAATAIFGDVARNVPVIGPLIASVVPAKAEPKVKKVVVAKPPPAGLAMPDTPAADAPPVEIARPVLQARREIRREVVAQRIANRLEYRAERREELGLPPRPPRAARIVPVLRRVPPGERAAIIERVREIRQEQRAANSTLPDGLPAVPDRASPVTPSTDLSAVPAVDLSAQATSEPPAGESLRTPERLEQLRRLRALRELQQRRRDMRRQRLQQ